MCKHTACVFVWTENRLSTCLSACEMWNRGGMCLCVYERAGVCTTRCSQVGPQLQHVCVWGGICVCSSSGLIGPNLPFSETGSSPLHVASWERWNISDNIKLALSLSLSLSLSHTHTHTHTHLPTHLTSFWEQRQRVCKVIRSTVNCLMHIYR